MFGSSGRRRGGVSAHPGAWCDAKLGYAGTMAQLGQRRCAHEQRRECSVNNGSKGWLAAVPPSFVHDKLPLWSHPWRRLKEWYGCLVFQGSSCSYHRGRTLRLSAPLCSCADQAKPITRPSFRPDRLPKKKRVRWDRVSRDGVCNIEHSSARPCASHAWSQRRLALLWPPSSHSTPASAWAWLDP